MILSSFSAVIFYLFACHRFGRALAQEIVVVTEVVTETVFACPGTRVSLAEPVCTGRNKAVTDSVRRTSKHDSSSKVSLAFGTGSFAPPPRQTAPSRTPNVGAQPLQTPSPPTSKFYLQVIRLSRHSRGFTLFHNHGTTAPRVLNGDGFEMDSLDQASFFHFQDSNLLSDCSSKAVAQRLEMSLGLKLNAVRFAVVGQNLHLEWKQGVLANGNASFCSLNGKVMATLPSETISGCGPVSLRLLFVEKSGRTSPACATRHLIHIGTGDIFGPAHTPSVAFKGRRKIVHKHQIAKEFEPSSSYWSHMTRLFHTCATSHLMSGESSSSWSHMASNRALTLRTPSTLAVFRTSSTNTSLSLRSKSQRSGKTLETKITKSIYLQPPKSVEAFDLESERHGAGSPKSRGSKQAMDNVIIYSLQNLLRRGMFCPSSKGTYTFLLTRDDKHVYLWAGLLQRDSTRSSLQRSPWSGELLTLDAGSSNNSLAMYECNVDSGFHAFYIDRRSGMDATDYRMPSRPEHYQAT